MTTRSRVVIYGAGYQGLQVLHHLQQHCGNSVELLGFIDDTKPIGTVVSRNMMVLGSLASAKSNTSFTPAQIQIVFAIGYASMSSRRVALDRVIDAGYGLYTFVHPRSIVEPGAEIGAGSVVLGGAIVDQAVRVGSACFLDIGVRLGAGTCMGVNNYLCSGTSTGSRVLIGDNCFVGMDCTITTDVVLGDNLIINAKTLVPRDVSSNNKVVEVHRSKQLPLPEGG